MSVVFNALLRVHWPNHSASYGIPCIKVDRLSMYVRTNDTAPQIAADAGLVSRHIGTACLVLLRSRLGQYLSQTLQSQCRLPCFAPNMCGTYPRCIRGSNENRYSQRNKGIMDEALLHSQHSTVINGSHHTLTYGHVRSHEMLDSASFHAAKMMYTQHQYRSSQCSFLSLSVRTGAQVIFVRVTKRRQTARLYVRAHQILSVIPPSSAQNHLPRMLKIKTWATDRNEHRMHIAVRNHIVWHHSRWSTT